MKSNNTGGRANKKLSKSQSGEKSNGEITQPKLWYERGYW